MTRTETVAKLKADFARFKFVHIEKDATISVNMDEFESLAELIETLQLINAMSDYGNRWWVTHDVGYYDAIENRRIDFHPKIK